MPDIYHIPALLQEAVGGLDIKPAGVYVDVTFGGGGHSREIISKLGPDGRLLAFDQDIDAYQNKIDDSRFTFIHSNFRFLKNFLRFHNVDGIDGLLADLGVSFHHFDQSDRGFTFREDCVLDMRMNRDSVNTAKEFLNTATQDELTRSFRIYGELDNAGRIAAKIVEARKNRSIDTTGQLCEIVAPFLDKRREKKDLAKVFQALRITVNNEMEALQALLSDSLKVLKPGARIAVISYHSLEDRMIKNFFKTGNIEGKNETDIFGRNRSPFKLLTSKPIVASEEEVERNPRSRSAKLRIAEKLG